MYTVRVHGVLPGCGGRSRVQAVEGLAAADAVGLQLDEVLEAGDVQASGGAGGVGAGDAICSTRAASQCLSRWGASVDDLG